MNTITVTKHADDFWTTHINNDRKYWAAGTTRAEAIADLVLSWGDVLGIKVNSPPVTVGDWFEACTKSGKA